MATKNQTIPLAILSCFAVGCQQSDPVIDDPLKVSIDEIAAHHLDHDYNVGIVVGVIRDGETHIWSYGETSFENGETPQSDSVFEIGSISKTFTGTLLAILSAEGTVQVEDPISKHIPELAGTDAGDIQLIELTTHTSGLPRLPDNLTNTDPTNRYAGYTDQLMLEYLQSLALDRSPYDIAYSNLGVGLLGYALSRATGSSYESLIAKHITVPLGMADTSVALNESQSQRVATGYNTSVEEIPLWNLGPLTSTGGIRSTVQDMLKYLAANMNPAEDFLGSTISASHEVQRETSGTKIGFNWFHESLGDYEIIVHNGQTGGFRSLIAFDKKNQIGFVMLTNTASAIECLKETVFAQDCELVSEYQHTENQIDDIVGRYVTDDGIGIAVNKRLRFLTAQADGHNKLRLRATANKLFSAAGGAVQIEFHTNIGGDVTRVVVQQPDETIEATKE